ncbi:hypothetical protein QU593_09740 [Rossellomorea marisflavi]|uniref:AbaSI family restriction endonuclease n=1 Tax=Rossellomorea marisflavi TaxID=189381 RepID=UPI0025B008C8|nr:hypothetical protein [Rossellomorea marisflavi]WJV20684.1 hypothetical protein QU593_09740 [Rossellomorea marisflavi]
MAIVEDQLVEIKWHGSNRKIYEPKGYKYTKVGEVFLVRMNDIAPSSHVLVEIQCDNCKEFKWKKYYEIANKERTFCNKKCFHSWSKLTGYSKIMANSRRTSILTNCKICNVEVSKKPYEFKGHGEHYCSRSCLGKGTIKTKVPDSFKGKITVQCHICQKDCQKHESVVNKNTYNFCSRECYSKYRASLKGERSFSYNRANVNCSNCNEDFTVIKSTENNKNHFCSRECYAQYRSDHYSGENHSMFGVKRPRETIEKMRISTAYRIANNQFPQTNTSINRITKTMLDELSIQCIEEKQFKFYAMDFYLPKLNLGIEVMGDYWHANPQKYEDYDSLNDIQKKDIKRDKSKRTYMRNHENINVLYLWEEDVNNRYEICLELIKKYVNNNGMIKDYNSFNYSFENGILTLNKDRSVPFFLRKNTKYQKEIK